MTYDPYPHGYGHNPHDEEGEVFDDPWLWDLTDEEIRTRWQQASGTVPCDE